MRKIFLSIALICSASALYAQTKDVVAENMLVYQRCYGGWPKAIHGKKLVYEKALSDEQKREARADMLADDATIDNKATTREIIYLANAYKTTGDTRYKTAVEKGINYLLEAQYENGGWPQYYPNKSLYRGQITYNDDAMINVLNVLKDVADREENYAFLDSAYAIKAAVAVEKGIDCILKTQLTINGKLTGWAAQYDEKTLEPAKARAFELASLSTSESEGVVKFLMRQKNPSMSVQTAVTAAIRWFDDIKITGWKAVKIDAPKEESGKDLVLVPDSSSVIWARFYDLKDMEPLFVGRDSVPHKKLSEVENERRAGYAWYGIWGEKLPAAYAKWKKKNNIQ